MTALAGIWRFDDRPDSAAQCARILKGQAIYCRRSAQWDGGAIAIGRHLFPLLPEDAYDQGPAVARDGARVLVADARIDNRRELAEALGLDRPTLARTSDAALMLRAFDRWEESAVVRFIGEFAFALWDARRHRLLLGRDFLGRRPLHLHCGKGFIAFASMPKGLHALPDIPRAVDRQRVAEMLALLPEPPSASFFEGIERVPPGHWLAVTAEGVRSQRYWHSPTSALCLPDARDYAEALVERLDQAVAVRLRGSDGALGAHLSAGMDSAAVVTSAARQLTGSTARITAFTAVPRAGYDGPVPANRLGDERGIAAAVAAQHANIDHVAVATDYSGMIEAARRYALLNDRPAINPAGHSWFYAVNDAAQARGVRVMLTGQMGNFTISTAGDELLAELLSRGRLVRLAREAAALRRGGASLRGIALRAVAPHLPGWAWRRVNAVRGQALGVETYSAVNPDAARTQRLEAIAASRGFDLHQQPSASTRASQLWALNAVDPGNSGKAMLGGWGIDMRDPTSDQRLVEFCLSVPAEQFHANGVRRALARRAFADRLPQALLEERWRGLQAADWHEGLTASADQWRDAIERSAGLAEVTELIDMPRLRRLAETIPDGGWDDPETIRQYRYTLLRGAAMADFLHAMSGSNR